MIDINKFIEDNINLIEDCSWLELYSLLRTSRVDNISNFNQILYKAGINPLNDLYSVPELFLAWSSVPSITIPNHVTTIEKYAFFMSAVDDTLHLPESLQLIQEQAFAGCKNITQLLLPDNIQVIEEKAFYDCCNLQNVILGKNVEYIMNDAFGNCRKLKHIYYKGSEEDWNRIHMTPHSFYMDEDDEYPFTIHYNYKGD